MILIKGDPVSGGTAVAPALVVSAKMASAGIGTPQYERYILVVDFATPHIHSTLLGAAALLAQSGGRTSHAAILAREIGIPCIVGIEDLMGTVSTGDKLRVDGNDGTIFINR